MVLRLLFAAFLAGGAFFLLGVVVVVAPAFLLLLLLLLLPPAEAATDFLRAIFDLTALAVSVSDRRPAWPARGEAVTFDVVAVLPATVLLVDDLAVVVDLPPVFALANFGSLDG